jgi:hypothetical protein
LGNIGRSGELDVGRVIKTKKNTVALRTAKNEHEFSLIYMRLFYNSGFPLHVTRILSYRRYML